MSGVKSLFSESAQIGGYWVCFERKSLGKLTMKSERRPPFSDVPRRWLNIAAVVGGVVGLLLSQQFGWSDVQTFIVTIGVAGLCVLMTILLHRALQARR
jgi:MFS family permease